MQAIGSALTMYSQMWNSYTSSAPDSDITSALKDHSVPGASHEPVVNVSSDAETVCMVCIVCH